MINYATDFIASKTDNKFCISSNAVWQDFLSGLSSIHNVTIRSIDTFFCYFLDSDE